MSDTSMGRPPSNDEQDRAEELDATTMRLDQRGPDDEGLPGVNVAGGDDHMSAEDPTLRLGGSDAQDSVGMREWRRDPEPGAGPRPNVVDPHKPESDGTNLVEPNEASVDGRDVEDQMIAEDAGGSDDATPTPAEVAAVTVDDDGSPAT